LAGRQGHIATLRRCNHRHDAGFLVPLLLVLATSAFGQTLPKDLAEASLEDLMGIKVETVYGASRHLQNVTQAPASVTIVTSDEIRRYGYRTLGDVLRSVPGFYITYDRSYTHAAVRGVGRTGDYNSRILLLIDGHRMNDDIYDSAPLGTEFPIDVDLIDRVEIIRGPSSSMYGSNAFFAVINVISKRGSVGQGLQLVTSAASYDTGYARVTYGGKLGRGWEALLSGSFYDSHGQERLYFREFDMPGTNHGITQNCDHDKFGQFFANLSYKALSLQAAYGSREKGVPTASYDTAFNDPRLQTTDNHGYVDIGYVHRFPKQFDFTAHAYFDNYTYDETYPSNSSSTADSQGSLNKDYVNGAWGGGEAKLSKPLFSNHLLTVGNEYRDNFRETQENFDVSPYHVYLNDHRSSTVWAMYAQDEYSIRKNLLLNAGVRYDRYSTFGGTTNPRVGLIYNPLQKTTLKLLYGTAFRAPNAFETFYQDGSSMAPNPRLGPETIRTAEFVVEQHWGDHYRLSGSVFQNRIDYLIDQVILPSGFLQFQNTKSVRAEGTELTFGRQWTSGMGAQINYTYERAVDRGSRTILDNVPAHLVNANLLVPLIPKKPRALTAGLDLHYVSSRRTLAGNTTPGFTVINVTLFARRLFKGFELSGSIYNLLDSHYGYPGGSENREDVIYQDGTNVRLKLAYTFGGHDK
jgi:outer membrane receptor for ferrienterochelin and colicins